MLDYRRVITILIKLIKYENGEIFKMSTLNMLRSKTGKILGTQIKNNYVNNYLIECCCIELFFLHCLVKIKFPFIINKLYVKFRLHLLITCSYIYKFTL